MYSLGDLTDAKSVDFQGSQQYEDEWITYDKVLKETKVTEKTVWLDVRGNHGKSFYAHLICSSDFLGNPGIPKVNPRNSLVFPASFGKGSQ